MRRNPPVNPKPQLTDTGSPVPIRRFEMGASGMGADRFLQACGWEVKGHRNPNTFTVKRIGSRGRPKMMSRKDLMALLDQERVKAGREPVRRRG